MRGAGRRRPEGRKPASSSAGLLKSRAGKLKVAYPELSLSRRGLSRVRNATQRSRRMRTEKSSLDVVTGRRLVASALL